MEASQHLRTGTDDQRGHGWDSHGQRLDGKGRVSLRQALNYEDIISKSSAADLRGARFRRNRYRGNGCSSLYGYTLARGYPGQHNQELGGGNVGHVHGLYASHAEHGRGTFDFP